MTDIFRILDQLNITSKGIIYTIINYANSNICIGDILYDLHGNRFKVKSLELLKYIPNGISTEDKPIGLIIEYIDKVEVQGNILVSNLSNINFIFCNHPLYPRKVDYDYEEEYNAASLELPCALFSYEELEMGKLSLYGDDISGLTIYRGWMMKPEMYRSFYDSLMEKGIILINTPVEYERYHTLPGWYDDFKDYTAKSVWEDKGTVDSALLLTQGLEGSYIVKDYVKSRKHEWHDACFIENISDKGNAERIIRNFVERQGSNLVGGVVLRKFEKLKSIGFHEKSGMPISEEYRVFVFAGKIMIIDDYWQEDQIISFSDEEMKWIESVVKRLKSNFVTIDIARHEDGSLIIMELGDGQVSGLQQIKPDDFYRPFCRRRQNGLQI
ncbi:MAG: ATP-grasp domain-containing protein [Lachnospiraceae bacterium]|nr:ATP-grasp domain-containing protein [Lachnospiraceae bacterium]